jgi:hypothetical protein
MIKTASFQSVKIRTIFWMHLCYLVAVEKLVFLLFIPYRIFKFLYSDYQQCTKKYDQNSQLSVGYNKYPIFYAFMVSYSSRQACFSLIYTM